MSTSPSWSSRARSSFINNGRARIIAVASTERLAALPDIPTFAELGVANFTSDTWNALSAPPKTPAAIIAKLNSAANEGLKSDDVQERFRVLNLTAGGGSPAAMGQFVRSETARWSEVIITVIAWIIPL